MEHQPAYILPADDPQVTQFRGTLHTIASEKKGMDFGPVTLWQVRHGDVVRVQQLVIAAQHEPAALEALVFGISFRFTYGQDNPRRIPEDEWKSNTEFMRWFRAMHGLPHMLFFLNDHEARFYALAGDLLADGRLEIGPTHPVSGQSVLTIPPAERLEMANRLCNASWFMYLYCHGTGIDPQPWIEALIAEYDLPGVHDHHIREKYEHDVKKGVKMGVSPTGPDTGQ